MIEPVDVEGWQAWALGAQLKPMAALKSPRLIRLLPQFDAYVVGVSRDCEPLLAKEHKARVYRPQGWISPVVLIDGRMEGVWSHDVQRSRTVIEVEMFSTAPARLKRDLRAEGQRLGEFLGSPVELLHGQD
jgi:hypothetical protein